jgi:hypothetical protein
MPRDNKTGHHGNQREVTGKLGVGSFRVFLAFLAAFLSDLAAKSFKRKGR